MTPSPRQLSPLVCRSIFALLLLLNFFTSWRYLTHNCPIDLSGDEAQYWDWSRHLDLCYYSKGPMVAYLIRASCAVLGNTMPAVRLPALLLAVGTSLCTYWLTRKLFGSDRLALGAFLLGAIVPMFAAGGMLMTIDPPLFFLWALATSLVAKAVFDQRDWPWAVAGLVTALGVLTKYVMLLWPVFVLLFLLSDRASRPRLKSPGPWVMAVISLTGLIPPIIWNARNGWVSLHHVAAQTGVDSSGALSRGNVLEFLGSQLAAINPGIAVIMIGAVICVCRAKTDPHFRAMRYLLFIGAGMFLICLLDSLVTKVQVNWPAPAYFTLLILTAYFLSTRFALAQSWKPWRGWFYGAVIFGLLIQPLLHDMTLLYPAISWVNRTFPRRPGPDGQPRLRIPPTIDLEYKLRGIETPLAKTVADQLRKLPPGALVMCEAYEDAEQLAFYLPGQPNTYFAGSYWTEIERDGKPIRRRWTQFDLWPDRRLDRPELRHKDVVYIGFGYPPFQQSFKSIEHLPDIQLRIRGTLVRSWSISIGHDFQGMHRPGGDGPR